MANLLNRTQAAALLGVSVAAIDKALRAGRITHADAARKLFDAAALPAQWAANRRRQRTPKPAADSPIPGDDPALPGDDSVPALQHRRLRAETVILEHKAKVGAGTRLAARGIGRAFFRFFTTGRAAEDAMHPKVLDLLDAVCPASDERYGALYADLFRLHRETWANIWGELAQAVIAEHPTWARRWFLEFAASESLPGSAAHHELERMREAEAREAGRPGDA